MREKVFVLGIILIIFSIILEQIQYEQYMLIVVTLMTLGFISILISLFWNDNLTNPSLVQFNEGFPFSFRLILFFSLFIINLLLRKEVLSSPIKYLNFLYLYLYILLLIFITLSTFRRIKNTNFAIVYPEPFKKIFFTIFFLFILTGLSTIIIKFSESIKCEENLNYIIIGVCLVLSGIFFPIILSDLIILKRGKYGSKTK